VDITRPVRDVADDLLLKLGEPDGPHATGIRDVIEAWRSTHAVITAGDPRELYCGYLGFCDGLGTAVQLLAGACGIDLQEKDQDPTGHRCAQCGCPELITAVRPRCEPVTTCSNGHVQKLVTGS
jgi:hypothetical protein